MSDLPDPPISKLETIRMLMERCPAMVFHDIVTAVNSASEIFNWAEDHGFDIMVVVDRIIDVYSLPTNQPIEHKQQLYGRKLHQAWKTGIERAQKGDRDHGDSNG
jgi:hypothetical protein